jgi:hypothetical protein
MAFAFCISLLAVESCKKSDGKLPVYPAKGRILVDGNPAKDMAISFWPAKIEKDLHAYCPSGRTDENGYFQLSTYDENDGAPAGEYTVTIEWPIGYSTVSNQWYGDHLQGRYSNQGTSDIKVKIEAKPNELAPIRIEMPLKKKS